MNKIIQAISNEQDCKGYLWWTRLYRLSLMNKIVQAISNEQDYTGYL